MTQCCKDVELQPRSPFAIAFSPLSSRFPLPFSSAHSREQLSHQLGLDARRHTERVEREKSQKMAELEARKLLLGAPSVT